MTLQNSLARYHRVVLYVTTLGLAVYGVMAMINPEVLAAGFHTFTDQDWLLFQTGNSVVAAYIVLLWRLIGIFNLMAGVVLSFIVWKWLKFGNSWSWITLFTGTILAYLGPIITDLTVQSIEIFEVIEFALFGLFLITMLLMRNKYWAALEKDGGM
ncbi:MAG: hypothetical protein ACFFF9_14680 [Candidatus Thorarchaeota archaeon]